jgi:TetR/AcrR family transcriptional regulator, repressor for neighboring sulfatase
VVAATLTVAADLFAEKGPAATSIRDVAAKAGVNHGLIHRHIGSKELLVGAVLDYLGQHLAELLAAGADGAEVDAAIDRQMRVIARATLDGYSVGELQTRFPNMAQLVDRMKQHHPDDRSARLAAAHLNALQIGWRLFGDFLRASTGLEELTDDELQRSLAEVTGRVTGA